MNLLIEIEYCRNCSLHSWCSHHDEVKYIDYFEQISKKITSIIPNSKVIERRVPDDLILRKNQANDGALYINAHTG